MTEKKAPAKQKPAAAKTPASRKAPTTAVRKTAAPRRAKPKGVSTSEIELKAYELWEQRGRPVGSPEVDWQNAMAQLQKNAEL